MTCDEYEKNFEELHSGKLSHEIDSKELVNYIKTYKRYLFETKDISFVDLN